MTRCVLGIASRPPGPVPVRVYAREAIPARPGPDAREFLHFHTGIAWTPRNGLGFTACALVRGRPEPVRVYVDDSPTIGGLHRLAMYATGELHPAGVYAGGRQIRADTGWFVERAVHRRLMPIPF